MTKIFAAAIVAGIVLTSALTDAYDPEAHRQIGERAVPPSLDRVLREEIGLPAGIDHRFEGVSIPQGRTVQELIGDGAFFEDVPGTRSLNHFHNPLADPWGEAGLRGFSVFGPALLRGQSSVLWQQNESQDSSVVITPVPLESGGGEWSWPAGRRRFLEALTNPTKDDVPGRRGRDRAFAELFETLGHLTHMIQDATVPAHVRNDAHPPFVRPDLYERWVEENRAAAAVQEILSRAPSRPELSIFTETSDPQAPAPIARLIDSDTFLGENPEVLSRDNPVLGVAEYTHGNFLSRGTMFKRSPFPRPSSLAPGPLLEHQPGQFRQYFTKARDGAIVDLFVAEGMLHQSLAAALAAPLPTQWVLDDRVNEAYARELLPRAVGYSAALLDYFFRGRLEVDLLEDGDDPSVVRMESTNRSGETMVEGRLTVYSEQPDGTRTRVSDLAAGAVVGVASGERLPGLAFPGSDTFARFVAVYTGTLGGEVRDAAANNPGAVIGKVFDAPRVEEVFAGEIRWQLRTPDGVFPLPIPRPEIEELRWGDVDNTLVGRTRVGRDAPNLFKAYRINRAVGSAAVPLRDADADGLRLVDAVETQTATLTDGLAVGTRVEFQGSARVTYDLLSFETRQPIVHDVESDEYFAVPSIDVDFGFSDEASDLQIDRRRDETHASSPAFDLTLARDKYLGDPRPRPYQWAVREMGLDGQGRILALVEVMLTAPENDERLVVIDARNRETGVFEPYFTHTLRVSFPIFSLLYAVVDVSAGQVVRSSAAPVVRPVNHATDFYTIVQRHARGTAQGGLRSGEPMEFWDVVTPLSPDALPPEPPSVQGGIVTVEQGASALSFEGWYRPEIAARVDTPLTITSATGQVDFVYAVVREPDGQGARRPPFYKTYQQRGTGFSRAGYVTALRGAERQRGAGADLLMVFGRPIGISEGEEGVLLAWKTERSEAALAVPEELFPADRHRLAGSTAHRALTVSDSGVFGTVSRIIDLENGTVLAAFFDEDLATRFRVLAPGFLYNVDDFRFYRAQPPLRRGALPAKLVPVAGNPVGDYHAVSGP